jgi:hypothetical protein
MFVQPRDLIPEIFLRLDAHLDLNEQSLNMDILLLHILRYFGGRDYHTLLSQITQLFLHPKTHRAHLALISLNRIRKQLISFWFNQIHGLNPDLRRAFFLAADSELSYA